MSLTGFGSSDVFSTTNKFRLEEVAHDPDLRRVSGKNDRAGPETLGRYLEAQFECDGGYLLLLTEDSPYEECLHILLLNDAYALLDSVDVGTPYTPGILENVRPQENRLVFEMYGYTWRVLVRQRSTRWPGLALPPGASRPLSRLFHRRYLKIDRTDNDTHQRLPKSSNA